ncbi:MAG TPA: PQQ-binding-like beta-propeller repeat protein, partial [Candidatus Polarisedimenticolaceae bacterium]|nr:PQQ-binding-like beta-propeller repeat protein [Candidatus Polarisedimenticolaceae bacterium]
MSKIPFSIALLALAAVAFAGAAAEKATDDWTQWGGPDHEFRATSAGLAKQWSADGPRELWTRELGDGYSAILYQDGKLYTMYRSGDEEAVVCLNAKTGKTVWEHRYRAAPAEGHVSQFGEGPRSTPLIAGGMIYTIGVAGDLYALDKSNGKPVWNHDL